MKRHKWKDIGTPIHPKSEKCIKCGIERYWCGGDMQGWDYLDLQAALNSPRSTFHRPECEPERGRTWGFNRKGEYLYSLTKPAKT